MASLSRQELTPSQQALADILRNTTVTAPVNRRRELGMGIRYGGIERDGFEFYKINREAKILDFPKHPGEFTSKKHELEPDADLLPYYINARNIPEEVLKRIGILLTSLPSGIIADFYAGIPNAGDKLAEACSITSGLPWIKVLDKEETSIGRKIVSNGHEPSPDTNRLLLIDNAITTGESVIEALIALSFTNWKVVGVLEIFDREEGGVERLAREFPEIPIFSALSRSSTFRYYLKNGLITRYRYYKIQKYIRELEQAKNK